MVHSDDRARAEPIPDRSAIGPCRSRTPLEILPAVVRDYVAEHSRVIGCDASAVAMACCLAGFSGALDHSFKIKMMRNGNWHESVRLWLVLIGDVSVKKTPIINAATHTLMRAFK